MLVNKRCPFCKILLRKTNLYGKQYKVHCFRCKNNFKEIDGVFYFNYNNTDIIIDESSIIINTDSSSFKIEEEFDVYNNFNEVLDKINTVIIFQ